MSSKWFDPRWFKSPFPTPKFSPPIRTTYTPFFRRFTSEAEREQAETQELYERVRAQFHASKWADTKETGQWLVNKIRDWTHEYVDPPDSSLATTALGNCLLSVLDLEKHMWELPTWSDNFSLKELVEFRARLRAQEHFLANETRIVDLLVEGLGNVIGGLLSELPACPDEDNLFTLPLVSTISKPNLVIDRVIGTICQEKHADGGVFGTVGRTLYENVCRASGVQPDHDHRRPLKTAADSDLPPLELVETYLRETPFYEFFLTPVPLAFDTDTRFSGHWIIAPPGRGKTTLLHAIFFNDLPTVAAGHASVILMDSKGDLIDPIRKVDFAMLSEHLDGRLVVIDPDPEFPLALNPLDITTGAGDTLASYRTVLLLEWLFGSLLEAKMTPLQSTLFRAVITLLVEAVPDATIRDFRNILQKGYQPYAEHIKKLKDEDIRAFFSKEQFDSPTYRETKNQILWRLQILMGNPVIKAMFTAPKTKLNLGNLINSGSIIVINANVGLLGSEGSEFFQRFWLAQLLAEAQRRKGTEIPCYVTIDECQTAISRDENIAVTLDTCRSKKIALCLSHQRMLQIKSPNILDALSNCAIRFANSDEEASQLAPRLRTTPDHLRSLPVGSFAAFIRDTTGQGAVTVAVPRTDISKFPKLSPSEKNILNAKMRRRYAVTTTPPQATAPPPPPLDDQDGSEPARWE